MSSEEEKRNVEEDSNFQSNRDVEHHVRNQLGLSADAISIFVFQSIPMILYMVV